MSADTRTIGGPCCAHICVTYKPLNMPGGALMDRWSCDDCSKEFQPTRPGPAPSSERWMADTDLLLPCPFCGGTSAMLSKTLRGAAQPDDPEAYAYNYRCHACAAEGGWAKSASGARRWWNTRFSAPTHTDLMISPEAIAGRVRTALETETRVHGVTWLLLREDLISGEMKVLLERCPKKREVLGVGEWFVPGGKVEPCDENSLGALVREMREEWNVFPHGVRPLPILAGSPIPPGPRGLFLMQPYVVDVAGEIRETSNDGIELRWTSVAEALASPVPQVRMMVAAALARPVLDRPLGDDRTLSESDRIAQLEARIYQLNRFVSAARRSYNRREPSILFDAITVLNDQNRTIAAGTPEGVRLVRSAESESLREGEETGPPFTPNELTKLRAWAAKMDVAYAERVVAESSGSGIYVASRSCHGEMWKERRAAGAPIVSTWIDECGQGETGDWPDLWSRCIAEATSAACVVLYAPILDGELKGALIETGAALAAGRRVFVVADVETRRYSWAAHPLVTVCGSISEAMELGACAARRASSSSVGSEV